MLDKKSKVVLKARVSRRNIRVALRQMSRTGPHCVACNKIFGNSTIFEEHLQTQEHKAMDSPLEFILERIGETENQPEEFRNLRLQALERGVDLENMDISDLPIGIDCISSVQVSFCQVCSSYVPEDGLPDVLRRHCSTREHISRAAQS